MILSCTAHPDVIAVKAVTRTGVPLCRVCAKHVPGPLLRDVTVYEAALTATDEMTAMLIEEIEAEHRRFTP